MAGQTVATEDVLVAIQHTIPTCINAFGSRSALVYALGDLSSALKNFSRLRASFRRPTHEIDLGTNQDEGLQEALRNCLTTVNRVRGLAKNATRDRYNGIDIPSDLFDKIKQFAIFFKTLVKLDTGSDHVNTNESAGTLHLRDESDTIDAWRGELVLSLDGGGVRGFATLIILEGLRDAIAEEESRDPHVLDSYSSPLFQTSKWTTRHEDRKQHDSSVPTNPDAYRLCHYFDYICGSSFGGMAAVMLGAMRCTVGETLDYSRNIWRTTIHTSPKFLIPLPALQLPNKERNSVSMRTKLQRTLGERSVSNEGVVSTGIAHRTVTTPTLNTTYGRCQTIVFAIQESSDGKVRPYAFRSYPLDSTTDFRSRSESRHGVLNPESDTSNVSVVDACLATSAVPSLFRKVKIPTLDGCFVDGGVWRTNPAEDVYRELQVRHQSQSPPVRALLSVGGRPALRESTRQWESLARSIDRIGELIHDDKDRFGDFLRTRQSHQQLKYDRLLCETTTKPSVHIDRMLASIEQEARDFVRTDRKTQDILRSWAVFLVKVRRQRSRTARWAVYAGLKLPQVDKNSQPASSNVPPGREEDGIDSRLRSVGPTAVASHR